MAKLKRPVGSSELIKKHFSVFDEIEKMSMSSQEHKQKIQGNIELMRKEKTLEILKQIPVEEVNRNKAGIRVKVLKENGYLTIADVWMASSYALESINGIGEDSVYVIKRIADEIAEQASNSIKIRLTTDDKSSINTQIVSEIFKYRKTLDTCDELKKISDKHKTEILQNIDALRYCSNGLTWLFASKDKKQNAIDAYQFLDYALMGEYSKKIEKCLVRIHGIENLDDNSAWKDFEENSIIYFNVIETIFPDILGSDDTVYGLPEDLAKKVQSEEFNLDGLKCQLRKYQEMGVKYILRQKRVLLGDEMGLGKTIQAIAAMVALRNRGETHFLVVCPASVLENWCREIKKHSDIKVVKIHGKSKDALLSYWIKSGGAAVTTYETTAKLHFDEGFKFGMLTVDEAHYIKNPEAKRTKNVRNICEEANNLLFMTGTALENRVDEMINLIKILNPQVATKINNIAALSAAPQFRIEIAPVYYRRKRDDVLTELPDLIEEEEWCTLESEEEAVYDDAVMCGQYNKARRVSWNIDDIRNSSKAKRMNEIIEEAASEGRKIIVFSFFLDTIRKIKDMLGDRCSDPINGSVPPNRRQEIIDEFDKAPAGNVLVSQIQAGGTGLNIQSASVVILCEPQFKPSTENQAISRAYRMGQTRNVLVYRLLCENTVDERIMELLESKQAEFDAFADESVAAKAEYEIDSNMQIKIMEKEKERIKAKRAG